MSSQSTMLGILTSFMAPRYFSLRVSFLSHNFHQHHVFPPPPSAPGGGGDLGHSGRRGKLYLATQAARAAATQRKEDRANVLLSRPNLAPPSTPSNRATRYKNSSDEKLLSEAVWARKTTRLCRLSSHHPLIISSCQLVVA